MNERIPIIKPKPTTVGPRGERIVRDERLQQILEGFYDEVGERTAYLLREYHKMFGEPMGLRIAWLELPWYKRWWLTLKAQVEFVQVWLSPKPTEPDGGEQRADSTGDEPEGAGGDSGPAEVL